MPTAPAPPLPAPAPPVDTPDRADDAAAAGRATAPDSPDPIPNPPPGDVQFRVYVKWGTDTDGPAVHLWPVGRGHKWEDPAFAAVMQTAAARPLQLRDEAVRAFWADGPGARYRELQRRVAEARQAADDAAAEVTRLSTEWTGAVERGEFESADRAADAHRRAAARAKELADRVPVLAGVLDQQRGPTRAALRQAILAAVGPESPAYRVAKQQTVDLLTALTAAITPAFLGYVDAFSEEAGFAAAVQVGPLLDKEFGPDPKAFR